MNIARKIKRHLAVTATVLSAGFIGPPNTIFNAQAPPMKTCQTGRNRRNRRFRLAANSPGTAALPSRPRNVILAVAMPVVMAILASPTWVFGQTLVWNNPVGGAFETAGNWTPGGPPGAGQIAEFNLAGSYGVSFSSSPTNSNLSIRGGNVAFDLNGNAYTLTNTWTVGDSATPASMSLVDGTINSEFVLATSAGSSGTLTIGNNAVVNAAGTNSTVGNVGIGQLNVNNGGQYVGTGQFRIGNSAGSSGIVNIDGIGSSIASGFTVIGVGGEGTLSVSNGGQYSGSSSTVVSQGGTGSLTVTGPGSTYSTIALQVGHVGNGTTSVLNGGSLLVSGNVDVAVNAGSQGVLVVSGNDSSLSSSDLQIGGSAGFNGGTGTMRIESGGGATISGTTTILSSAGSKLVIDGGSLVTGGFTRLGTLEHRDGLLHVTGVFDNGAAIAPLVVDGNDATALPTLRMSGNSAINDVSSVTVGQTRQGALLLDNGRVLNSGANNISIGSGITSSGTIGLSGNNTAIQTTGVLAVGGSGATAGGIGVLNVGSGSTVTATTLNLFDAGEINLNGGTVNVTSFNDNAGTVNFNSGKFAFAGSQTLNGTTLDSIVGPAHMLGSGRTLASNTGTLTVAAPMTVNGGTLSGNALVNDNTLQATSGSLVSSTTITNNAGRLLAIGGNTAVTAATGITNNGTIRLDDGLVATAGGTLSNNGIIRGLGFIGNNLTNNVAGSVQLTTGNRLQFQGGSNSNSGAISLVGGEVHFTGALTNATSTGLISSRDAISRFDGGLTNHGSMGFSVGSSDVFGDVTNTATGIINVSGGGQATFYDDVVQNGTMQVVAVGNTISSAVMFGGFTGSGGFTGGGDVFALGDLRPGNSPASVLYDGNLFLGSTTETFIELGGTDVGQFDQLLVTGDLGLAGDLSVSLINGFTLSANQQFLIGDIGDDLTGQFNDLGEGSLIGIFGGRELFISYSGGNGNDIAFFTAVPEPGVAGLAVLALVVTVCSGRRRKESVV